MLPSQEDLDAVVIEKDTTPLLEVRDFSPTLPPKEPPIETKLNNIPGQCFKCDQFSINFCRHCGQEFCAEHKSKYSNGICCLCVASDNLGLEYVEIIDEAPDDEGLIHTHRGRRIKLIGEGWPNAMQLINTLTEEGLVIFLEERKRLLQEATQTTEYYRITVSFAEFRLGYLRKSKRAKLEKRLGEIKKQGTIRVGNRKVNLSTAGMKAQEAKQAAALGLTPQQWTSLKKMVSK